MCLRVRIRVCFRVRDRVGVCLRVRVGVCLRVRVRVCLRVGLRLGCVLRLGLGSGCGYSPIIASFSAKYPWKTAQNRSAPLSKDGLFSFYSLP